MFDHDAAGFDPDRHWEPRFDGPVDLRRLYDTTLAPMPAPARNMLVTAVYDEMDHRMRTVLGGDVGNWFTFAKWPSFSIRRLVRHEGRIPADFSVLWPLSLPDRLARAFGHGNADVCLDMGWAALIWLETVGAVARRDDDTVTRAWNDCVRKLGGGDAGGATAPGSARGTKFPLTPADIHPEILELLDASSRLYRPVDPRAGSSGPEAGRRAGTTRGEEPPHVAVASRDRMTRPGFGRPERLVRGFEAYTASLLSDAASDPVIRHQRIWAGNVLIGAHEQDRVAKALAAGVRVPIRQRTMPQGLTSQRDWRRRRPTDAQLREEEQAVHEFTAERIEFRVGRGRGSQLIRIGDGAGQFRIPDDLSPTNPSLDPRASVAWALAPGVGDQTTCWLDLDQRIVFMRRFFAAHHRSVVEHDLGDIVDDRVRSSARSLIPAVAREVRRRPSASRPKWMPSDRVLNEARRRFDDVARRSIPRDMRARAARVRTLTTPEDLERSAAFYEDNRLLIHLALQFAALPEDFSGAQGVRVLTAASDLLWTPFRRGIRVGRFLDAVCSEPFLERDDVGFASIAATRAQHASIRRRLRPDWDVELLGEPINAEDLLGTLVSFVVPVVEAFGRVGITIDPETRDAYARRWLAIGHLLGVELRFLTRATARGERLLTYDEIALLGETFRRRHRRRNLDGIVLMRATLQNLEDHLPNSTRWLPAATARVIGGDEVADLLCIPPVGRARRRLARLAVSGASSAMLGDSAVARRAYDDWLARILVSGGDDAGEELGGRELDEFYTWCLDTDGPHRS